jgi:hypothetical protein
VSETVRLSDELRDQVVAWLRANDINPKDIPPLPFMSLAGDRLTTQTFVRDAAGNRVLDPAHRDQLALTSRTFTITTPPPADVAEWLRPRCRTCGR